MVIILLRYIQNYDLHLHRFAQRRRGSSCGRADSVIDSHTTGPGFKTRLVRYFLPSFRLTTTASKSGLTLHDFRRTTDQIGRDMSRWVVVEDRGK